mgnify:CR=1 FL=1|tara:strand:- start:1005 stop:1184 length:180 start_codon:yes stop_codon:yes gene_type:complete
MAVPPDSGFVPKDNGAVAIHNLELLLVKVMITASRADGQMDVEESQTIFKKIRSFDLDE